MSYTDNVIERLTEALAGGGGLGSSPRELHIYRESLLALVRLAKAEQLLEIREDFTALTQAPRLIFEHPEAVALLQRLRRAPSRD